MKMTKSAVEGWWAGFGRGRDDGCWPAELVEEEEEED